MEWKILSTQLIAFYYVVCQSFDASARVTDWGYTKTEKYSSISNLSHTDSKCKKDTDNSTRVAAKISVL